MALPSSGAISTSQIQAEIGDTGSITIPDANTRTLTGKSTGPLVIPNDFWGKSWSSSVTASISARTVSASSIEGIQQTATYKIASNGNVYDHNATLLEAWLDSGTNADFQVRATKTGTNNFAMTGSALGSWLATTADQSWSLTIGADGGTISQDILVEIRNDSTLTVLTSATITIQASSTSGGGGGVTMTL